MILGGDLGGTKTLLALAESEAGRIRIVHQQRFASADECRRIAAIAVPANEQNLDRLAALLRETA